MEGTVVIICIAHNIFINIQQSHFYRCSCRPWKVLHNPEAVPKCGYFAPQWNANNSSFMFLCFLGFEDTWECTVPKVTKYIKVRDVQNFLPDICWAMKARSERENILTKKWPKVPQPTPKSCFSGCPYEPWPAKSFRCWRKNVDKCQEAFHSQRTIGAKPVKSSAQLLQSLPWLP